MTNKTHEDPQVVTLGCRLNIHESDVMVELAKKAGLENAIIVNTCAVTAEAERQAKQTIRKLRKENPHAYLIATGCAVQIRPEDFAKMPEIDRILGNDIKMKEESFHKDFAYRAKVGPIMSVKEAELPLMTSFKGQNRAFLQIQNGCNHRCTFCTIPLGRGKSRSVPLTAIVNQARLMLEKGVEEIILTGVDLTSYGENLPGRPTLANMLRRLLGLVPELSRVRISSLDSVEIDEDLLECIVGQKRILPHLHLSLQAGDNFILKRMQRRHLREQAIDICQTIKRKRKEIVLGADFIVGFPGETEEMFQNTLALVQECSLTHLHVFPFSKRPGTVAATLDHQIPQEVIKERAFRLREAGSAQKLSFYQQKIGSIEKVLVEKQGYGHTDDFTPVFLSSETTLKKGLIHAKILSADLKGVYACAVE